MASSPPARVQYGDSNDSWSGGGHGRPRMASSPPPQVTSGRGGASSSDPRLFYDSAEEDAFDISHIDINSATVSENDLRRAFVVHPAGPDVISALSTIQISTKMLKRGEPIANGLYDPRIGPSDRRMLCSTCSLPYNVCQGHNGEIIFGNRALRIWVYNPLFVDTTVGLLRVVCHFCTRALFTVERPMNKDTPFETHLQELTTKRSGSSSSVFRCPHPDCGKPQPNVAIKTVTPPRHTNTKVPPRFHIITRTWPACVSEELTADDLAMISTFTPEDAWVLLHFDAATRLALGLPLAGTWGCPAPQNMMMCSMAVPPIRTRPPVSRFEGGAKKSHHFLTSALNVVATKARVLQAPDDIENEDRERRPKTSNLIDIYVDKMRMATEAYDAEKAAISTAIANLPEDSPEYIEGVTKLQQAYLKQLFLERQYKADIYNSTEYGELQNAVSVLMSSSKPLGVSKTTQGKNTNPLVTAIGKGKGCVARRLTGKRVAKCARVVAICDAEIKVDEVGLNHIMAKTLTKQIPVTQWNLETCRGWVRNGPDCEYGTIGCNAIQKRDGTCIDLKSTSTLLNQQTREEVRELYMAHRELFPDASELENEHAMERIRATVFKAMREKYAMQLEEGDMVRRHLKDGDYIALNRCPTLHKGSYMSLRLRIFNVGRAMRINPGITTPFNGDFDGDEFTVYLYTTFNADAESVLLMSVCRNMINPASGRAMMGSKQDSFMGLYFLTSCDTLMTRDEFTRIAFCSIRRHFELPPPAVVRLRPRVQMLWTGMQVISLILRETIGGFQHDCRNASIFYRDRMEGCPLDHLGQPDHASPHAITIVDGQMYRGVFMANTISSGGQFITSVSKRFGSPCALRLMELLQRAGHARIAMQGFAISGGDFYVNPDALKKAKDIIETYRIQILEFHRKLEQLGQSPDDPRYERIVENHINQLQNMLAKMAMQSDITGDATNILKMITSGGKGSPANQQQMLLAVGQQTSRYGRPFPPPVSFSPQDRGLLAGGFIVESLAVGRPPQQEHSHARTSAESLNANAAQTWMPGYASRQMAACLSSLTVTCDGSIRMQNGTRLLVATDGMYRNCVRVKLDPFTWDAAQFAARCMAVLPPSVGTPKARVALQAIVDELVASMSGWVLTARTYWSIGALPNIMPETRLPFDPATFLGSLTPRQRRAPGELSATDITELSSALHTLIFTVGLRATLRGYWTHMQMLAIVHHMNVSHAIALGLTAEDIMNPDTMLQFQICIARAQSEHGNAIGVITSACVGEPAVQVTMNMHRVAGQGTGRAVVQGAQRLLGILNCQIQSLVIFNAVIRPSYTKNPVFVAEMKRHNVHFANTLSAEDVVSTSLSCVMLKTLCDTSSHETLSAWRPPAYVRRLIDIIEGGAARGGNAGGEESLSTLADLKGVVIHLELRERDMHLRCVRTSDVVRAIAQLMKPIINVHSGVIVFGSPDDFWEPVPRIHIVIPETQMEAVLKMTKVANVRIQFIMAAVRAAHDYSKVALVCSEWLIRGLAIKGIEYIEEAGVTDRRVEIPASDAFTNPSAMGKRALSTIAIMGTEKASFTTVCAHPSVIPELVTCDCMRKVGATLGMNAARRLTADAVSAVLKKSDLDPTYLMVLAASLTKDGFNSISRHGINAHSVGPLGRWAFEDADRQIVHSALNSVPDRGNTPISAIMMSQTPWIGTGASDVVITSTGAFATAANIAE